jgi:hypothetical protein
MKKAVIGIDDWKLPTFSRILEEEGYTFTINDGVTDDSLLLIVYTDDLTRLSDVVFRMNAEAAKLKMN